MTGTVVEWLAGKEVLVTGGTGFMGKVLLEKLLRSTEVRTIYLLIRPKRGLAPQARISEMFKLPLFEGLRKNKPEALRKVIALEGDLGAEDLGLSAESKRILEERVEVVYNMAASLKLEDTLKTLIEHNTLGTLRLLRMAESFSKLQVLCHLSTAFCHCEEDVLEEKLYPPPANPYDVIQAVSWMDEETANTITPKLLGPHPNCYTYTKRLAEGLIADFADKVPIVIARPSIVTPAVHEPVPGWVDNLNGPVGVMVAGAKGVLRSMLCVPHHRAEVIPVDVAINGVILMSWKRAVSREEQGRVAVFNLSSGEIDPISWGKILELGRDKIREYPFEAGLWYPGGTIRTNPLTHALIVLLAQTIPAYLVDFLMYLTRNKRFMVRVQNRIRLGMQVLQYFTMRQWTFRTGNIRQLMDELTTSERQMFYTTNVEYILDEYMRDIILGARLYCVKEPLSTLSRARNQLKILYWVEKGAQAALVLLFFYMLYSNIGLFQTFLDGVITTASTYPQSIPV